jgi:hypothetical protein
MTRTHAAIQLLRLGPLSASEFREITGWPQSVCRSVLTYLVDRRGIVERVNGVHQLSEVS